ncbi:MAG TPA: glycerate kinase [Mycobacteriales bacterium]|nr:glycerate kinase [Mycobacteriales bacterium]
MRVLIAPDCFTGSLSAAEVAQAIGDGWRRSAPRDTLDPAPLSDGGPGFLDVLAGVGGALVPVTVADPLGRPVPATLLTRGPVAYVESAQACGLHLLAVGERDPERTSTAGVGMLLRAALDAGATRIVVGLGGSGTNDGGRGALQELGADVDRLRAVDLVVATDVDNPLLGPDGATAVFGPQKGADPAAMARLERAMAAYASTTGTPEHAAAAGAGAAGGLGFALLACGGRRVSGCELVFEEVGLPERVAAADLVITGEGRYDAQSARGKVPAGVAALAAAHGTPCVLLAGQIAIGHDQTVTPGVTEWHGLADPADPAAVLAAQRDAARLLRQRAARIGAQWSSAAGH